MRCFPSPVSYEVQTTRLSIKSFYREVEMAEQIWERFTRPWNNRRCGQKSFSSYICRFRLFHSSRKFCHLCRTFEIDANYIFGDHESNLCPSSNAQCQSKGRGIHCTVLWKPETTCWRLRMHEVDSLSTQTLSTGGLLNIGAQVWRHSVKYIGSGRLQGQHR